MYGSAMLVDLTVPLSAITHAVAHTVDHSSMVVLVQSGTGAGAGTATGLETGKSGTGNQTDVQRGSRARRVHSRKINQEPVI